MVTDLSRDDVRFYRLQLGGDRNFSYLFGDKTKGWAAAIDPGFAADEFQVQAAGLGLKIQHILITHGHSDHAGAAGDLARITGAEIHAGPQDQVPEALPLADGQEIQVGGLTIQALHTPGHTAGHICFHCGNILVTGDLLFCGKIGGTGPHFPGSSAEAEYASLQRLMQLPDETGVFPGHDYYGGEGTMPDSTIGFERRHNPFLTVADFTAFCHLKDNWAEYKQKHGIR